jgi:hypothetical protein
MIADLNVLAELAQPCPACANKSLCGKEITPNSELAQRGLVSLSATRCYACGDVRLFGRYSGTADRLELRDELDYLAAMLTEVACEDLSDVLH